MKFTLAISFLASLVCSKDVVVDKQDATVYVPKQYRNLQATNGALALPTQTYFVPIPDQLVYDQVIKKLNNEPYIVAAPVTHILAITISTDNTVVWYDHWEDGYDLDVTDAYAKTTLVWGDGKASNGCAPIVSKCTDAADVLKAGNNILLKNDVGIPRNKAKIFYDGGDRVQASYPVTMTRAGHPHKTAVLASAIQALDMSQWGTTYEAPVGVDIGKINESFEWTMMVYQAGSNDTIVTLPNLTNVTLQMGESGFTAVNQGDQIASDKPIQVILVTGDIDLRTSGSKPETRWFGIRSVQQNSNSYISPVGDTIGKSRFLIYNPNPDNIEYTMQYLNNGALSTLTGTVNSKKSLYSPIIPYDSGAIIESTHNFVALSITDTEEKDSRGVNTYAATYDWGFAATPTNLLTPEVLVGLGWGCLHNVCPAGAKNMARSVVWITPVENADIYVSYNNDNTTVLFKTKRLESIRVSDPIDKDMTGASIFAVRPNTGINGLPIDISVAWGQDPTLAINPNADWQSTMDMGVVILPLSIVTVAKLVDKTTVKADEELEYTIRISNSGRKIVYKNTLTLFDTLDAEVQYIAGSTVMVTKSGNVTSVKDSATGTTPFPFDETGFLIPIELDRRGFYVDFVFRVKVATQFLGEKEAIVNKGILKNRNDNSVRSFGIDSKIDFTPAIIVDNTVSHGADEAMCEFGEDSVAGKNGTEVVYCFNITNTGNSYLSNITIANAKLFFNNTAPVLAPGKSMMITVISKISANLTNNVFVTAKPTLADGTIIVGKNDVNASDPSSVVMKTGLDGNVKSGDILPVGKCLEDNWKQAGKTDGLVCASKEIYIESLTAKDASVCMPGETITLTVNATILLTGPRSDIGWYVANDGGDALVGTCVTNGLDNFGSTYDVVDVTTGTSTVGTVKWTTSAGVDHCGDVVLGEGNTAAKMAIPLLVNSTIICADENDDGVLDFATCFNWKSASDVSCSLSSSIPDNNKGCFCTRVDVPNLEVVKKVNDPIKAC